MGDMKHLQDLNLLYQLKLKKLEDDFKNLERSKLQLEETVAHYVNKDKEHEIQAANYASLREDLSRLSTLYMEKRTKTMELQKLLFESSKELANVRHELQDSKTANQELTNELQFIKDIRKKTTGNHCTNSTGTSSTTSSDDSTVTISSSKSSINGKPVNKMLQNRILDNVRRQNRKSQSLESLTLSSAARRRAIAPSTAAVPKSSIPKTSSVQHLNKASTRKKTIPVQSPKTPNCDARPIPRRITRSVTRSTQSGQRTPCGTINGQVSNQSNLSVASTKSIISGKSQKDVAPSNLSKPKATSRGFRF